MKTLEMLTNVDKARIIFDLFTDEIPDFLEYAKHMADKVIAEEESLKANWDNPFLSYHQWRSLAEQVKATVNRKGKTLQKSGKVFAEQVFSGYTAIFSNHCMEQFAPIVQNLSNLNRLLLCYTYPCRTKRKQTAKVSYEY